MNRAILYFHARTRWNRVLGLLRRLKEPRYALGVIPVGIIGVSLAGLLPRFQKDVE